ncbi:MAG: sulfatase-like hydrolase/transferase [Verrucomicrobiae bacterium]|nr:sulfatase-like hydrolase/transferase [Verrucomicrobiae bacterium]
MVIVADDLGYADVLFNPRHPKEITTPHLDALAKSGVICRQGYVSGHVWLAHARGLMTGRYQQRLGLYTGGEAGQRPAQEREDFPAVSETGGLRDGAVRKVASRPRSRMEPGAARLRRGVRLPRPRRARLLQAQRPRGPDLSRHERRGGNRLPHRPAR